MAGRRSCSALASFWLLTVFTAAPRADAKHQLSLLSGRARAAANATVMEHLDSGVVPVEQTIEESMKQAQDAAKQAWALSHKVDEEVKKLLKNQNGLDGEIATAKAAAETAKKKDEKATALFYKTRTKAVKAALFAARAYYDEVKRAGANADKKRKEMLTAAAHAAELNAAKAASSAAMPYHAQLLRGQKIVVDYLRRAQALGAASINLKKEGFKLSQHAEAYQQNNQLAEASQIMMQAHSLMSQGEAYASQAAQLESTAHEINGALPALQMAGQAAAESAAMSANPLTKDYLSEHYPY